MACSWKGHLWAHDWKFDRELANPPGLLLLFRALQHTYASGLNQGIGSKIRDAVSPLVTCS